MFDIARNSTGLLEGRKPARTELEARAQAARLVQEHREAFQIWDEKTLIDVITTEDVEPAISP